MIISGLRTSWAIDGGQPAEGGEPLAQRGLALEARDRVGERAEGPRHEPGVLVVPGPAGPEGEAQVAGGRDPLHRVGEGGERPGDRAREGPAQEEPQAHRDERGDREGGPQRRERAQRLRARAQHEDEGRGPSRAERRAQGRVLLAVQDDPRHPRASRGRAAGPRRAVAAASRRRRAPPSPRPRGCRSARAGAPRTRRRGRTPARGGPGPPVSRRIGRVDRLEEPPALHAERPRDVRPARARPPRARRASAPRGPSAPARPSAPGRGSPARRARRCGDRPRRPRP